MKPLRVGLVGAGHISATHLRGWRRAKGCEVVAILDRERAAAEARARQFDVPTVCESIEQLIEACNVVDVCTPPAAHYALARQIVDSGRHLVIEKPIVTDVDEWIRLRESIEAGDRSVCVVHNIKFSAAMQQALRWVASGRIGRILRLERSFLTHASQDRMLVADAHWSHSLPGGRWFETLPHALYMTHCLVGELELDSVSALATPEAPTGAPADEVVIVLKGQDCIATISYSAHCKRNRRFFSIEGTEGSIEVDGLGDAAFCHRNTDHKWRRPLTEPLTRAASVAAQWLPNRTRYLIDRAAGRTPHSRLLGAFAAHLNGDGENPTPLAEVDYVVRMSDRIGRAIERSHS